MAELSIRPYQGVGLDFLADTRRAALFDEPGLGKTMQALLAMRDLEPRDRILVVSPGDAIGVWQDEIKLWLDEEPGVYAGSKPNEDQLDITGSHSIVITNYHRLANVLRKRTWQGIIFDECQMLRNRKTVTLFDSVRKELRKGGQLAKVPIFCLSGTPVVKSTGDLWPIMHLLDRQAWSSYWAFVNKYCIVWQDDYGWHVEGVTNTPGLWRDLSPWVLRRTVEEVQPNLPPIIRQRVPLEMTPKQAKVYRALEEDMFAAIDDTDGYGSGLILAPTVLALETRLRQLLVSPRLLGVDDDGASVKALGEIGSSHSRPLVVFSPYPTAFPFVADALMKSTGRPSYVVKGGMGQRFRESVDLFKRAAKAGAAPVLLASVEMAKGWDAAAASYEAYMLGSSWNGTTQLQAEMRLRRGEQKHTVVARYFTHIDTFDGHVIDVATGKLRLSDAILDRHRLHKDLRRRRKASFKDLGR